jgi:hypothetical protein
VEKDLFLGKDPGDVYGVNLHTSGAAPAEAGKCVEKPR